MMRIGDTIALVDTNDFEVRRGQLAVVIHHDGRIAIDTPEFDYSGAAPWTGARHGHSSPRPSEMGVIARDGVTILGRVLEAVTLT